MKSYSQNHEDIFIKNYFGLYTGTLLEIGANDGVTLSNSKLLIDIGWSAVLVEPGSIFDILHTLHEGNHKVKCLNYAIGVWSGEMTLHESGCHVVGGKDTGLVSSLDFEETERWRNNGVFFTEKTVPVKTISQMIADTGINKFDFISIDAEGFDWEILQQIDLKAVDCKCLCIEHNSLSYLELLFTEYCEGYGMKLAVKNNENLIFIK